MKRAVLIKPDGSVEPFFAGEQSITQTIGGDPGHIASDTRVPNMTFVYSEKYEDDPQPRNTLASELLNTPVAGNVIVLGAYTEAEGPGSGEIHGLTVEQVNIFLSPEGEDILNALTKL